ncbi:MAG: N-acetyltransferase [Oscillospiraceae bacterium]|nr:N-acetyltransferase [Oscillospiraceae bacterium]
MIRHAVLADVPQILDIYAPYILNTAITFEYDVPTVSEFEARFLSITKEGPWLVWEENGRILGYAYGEKAFVRAAYQWAADLAVYLRPEAQGKGIGKALYTAVEDILRQQGYCLCYGVVTSANEKSCAFHEAMGYVKRAEFPDCGMKFGKWYGTIWYEKRLRDGIPTHAPCPPEDADLHSL